MKVDEPQEIQNKMNPLVESKGGDRNGDAGDMSLLTSVQTEERLKEAVQHRARDGDQEEEEFLHVPLKRTDSGPHLQEHESATGTHVKRTENNDVTHCALLDEIDHSYGSKAEAKGKTGKKDNTLTRMFKGFRVDKHSQDETEDKLGPQVSISKIFHRINPVGKVSRENFSKVFHRIGDALQKKSGEDEGVKGEGSVTKDQPESTKVGHGEQKCQKIGEKMFRYRPSTTDARKTNG